MSGDTLVYDMSSMSEGTPQVFVKKDWLNILDNQNGNYNGNQSVIDTSQLANSNKYMNYREAYLAVPMLLTASNLATGTNQIFTPNTGSVDYAFGLRNWFGSIIHSFTLDYNGTTIIQQTPFVGMWNCFRLLTTLSKQDVLTNGAQMGFYPDDPLAWGFATTAGTVGTLNGLGVYNNQNAISAPLVAGTPPASGAGFATLNRGNEGFLRRQQYIAYDPDGYSGGIAGTGATTSTGAPYSAFIDIQKAKDQYKSYIVKGANYIQYNIMAIIQLKHIHNFFQNVPLLKGVFMKMTLNLNQSSITMTQTATATLGGMTVSVNSPLGGVSPIMVASGVAFTASNTATANACGSNGFAIGSGIASLTAGATPDVLTVSIAVGNKPLVSTATAVPNGGLNQSIQLYVPAYTFNPTFEDAYLQSPVKTVVYTDIYQYQVPLIQASTTFNQLITNGIANIKSVLVIPFLTSGANGTAYQPFQSPFCGDGSGTTAPLSLLTNFNIVVAGQNMIYNTERYSYEQFMNQLQGANAINADMTDGLTSSLIDKLGFENEYCYYYVDCSRMLPVEEAVPKSVSILGTNSCLKDLQFIVFVEYGVQVSIDVLTGARV